MRNIEAFMQTHHVDDTISSKPIVHCSTHSCMQNVYDVAELIPGFKMLENELKAKKNWNRIVEGKGKTES